jgi:hypothetical protein
MLLKTGRMKKYLLRLAPMCAATPPPNFPKLKKSFESRSFQLDNVIKSRNSLLFRALTRKPADWLSQFRVKKKSMKEKKKK